MGRPPDRTGDAVIPRWLTGLLEAVAPPALIDELVGDLEELAGRRRTRFGRLLGRVITIADGLATAAAFASMSIKNGGLGMGAWISASEVRMALRLIRKQPVLTATAVLALASGIGIASAGFTVAHNVLFAELPFEGGEHFTLIQAFEDEGRRANTRVDLERFEAFRSGATAFEYLGIMGGSSLNLSHESGEVEQIAAAFLSPRVFTYLPYTPVTGRLPIVGDGTKGTEVALIRESLWRRRYSEDPNITDRSIELSQKSYQIVGVLPDDAGFPTRPEVWIPINEETGGATDARDQVQGFLLGILSPGASTDLARSQVETISQNIESQGRGVERLYLRTVPLARILNFPEVQALAFTTIGLLLMVLVVIAANVANLIIVRTAGRTGELAVRTALGASRGRLLSQLFLEVLIMALLAAVVGLIPARLVLDFYDASLTEIPFWITFKMNGSTVAFIVAVTVLGTAVAGMIPGLRATRNNAADALRHGRSGLGIGRVGAGMIVLEVALSVALLSAAGMTARGLSAYLNPSFSLPQNEILTAAVELPIGTPEEGWPPNVSLADSLHTATTALRAQLADLPGVTNVAFASQLPGQRPPTLVFEVEDPGDAVATTTTVPVVRAGSSFWDVIDKKPITGRTFNDDDLRESALPVAIVNETFASTHFGTPQVLGERIRFPAEDGTVEESPWHEIIGVVPDVMEVADPRKAAGVYLPLRDPFFTVALRANRPPMQLEGDLRRALFDFDERISPRRITPLEEVGSDEIVALRGLSWALSGMGIVALLLSLSGLYSVMSLSVTQRTREIGVRVALGARAQEVLLTVVQRSGVMVAIGVGLGIGLGALLVSGQSLFTFSIPPTGAWLFPAVAAVTLFSGVVACWIPASRALRIRPVDALKYD